MGCKPAEKPKQKHKKGLWSPDEDDKLKHCIIKHGHVCWSSVPINTVHVGFDYRWSGGDDCGNKSKSASSRSDMKLDLEFQSPFTDNKSFEDSTADMTVN
ncbi:hypothetical protein RND71_030147 [Anisodus tanguticus]|uniref:HTH myb-type domain-containing protein n=1 Tax=Anisodus tanguticus TaxID=243964 RepID=A0AAE1REQ8_9SOLA|nr:hypothetical protein RND71_030147 [Anisodus tanguticus]